MSAKVTMGKWTTWQFCLLLPFIQDHKFYVPTKLRMPLFTSMWLWLLLWYTLNISSCLLYGLQKQRRAIEKMQLTEGFKLIKLQYIHVWHTKENPPGTIIHFLKNEGQTVKQVLPGGTFLWGECKLRGWKEANMVDVVCIRVWK
jgi:hypothetical protein